MKTKLKIYKIILTILIIAGIVTTILIVKKYSEQYEYDKQGKEVLETFSRINEKVEENEKRPILFNGYQVIGTIKIPKIELEYPILDKTTKKSMLTSISRFWGGDINSYGNVSLAGHNNRLTLTMFGKNKFLKKDDSIFLTDLENKTIEYKIYDIFTTDPNDVSILQTTDESVREVTLITCNKGHENRLIIKAREIK